MSTVTGQNHACVCMKVIHLTKTINSTSSAWNEHYPMMRHRLPGAAYPTLQIKPGRPCSNLNWSCCRNQHRRYFSAGLLSGAFFLRKLSKRTSNNLVVHVHTPILFIVVAFSLLVGASVTVVNTQHNIWSNFRLHQKIALWLISFFSRSYIGCSERATESLPGRMKGRLSRNGRLHTISNGIPANVMRDYAKRRQKAWNPAKNINHPAETVVVARMVPQKNGLKLLRLVHSIPELGRVTWFGHGEMMSDLRAERKRLGLDERVIFAGLVSRDEVYDALVRSDFYLTVSRWEGLSVADLEAVAIGCLPLMSNIPERHVIANRTGVSLLPVDDSTAWKQTARDYLQMSSKELHDFSAVLSERACQAFSLEEMARSYIEVYRDAVGV